MMPTPVYDAVLERLKGLHPKVIDLALGRVQRLLAALDHPECQLPPVVHVAGTNGKGSCCAHLRAMLEAAGKSVHVYTSPHLVRFAERIRVAGQIIGDDALTALLEECEQRNSGQPITFFEITTAAAFLAFARQPADVCLLETGLGGRVDATNVLDRPALTVLTSISIDHQAFLGNSLAEIAGEKAGILKSGVPCVVAAQEPDALAVILARAQAVGTPLFIEGRDWSVQEDGHGGLLFSMAGRSLSLPRSALPGPHQVGNAGVAVAAALILNDALVQPLLTDAAIAHGLRTVEWPARMQQLTRGPLRQALPSDWELWLDGGHNPSAGQMLGQVAAGWSDRPLYIVSGMINTKDGGGFLAPLSGKAAAMLTVSIPDEPNSLTAQQLADMAQAEGVDAQPVGSLAEAIARFAVLPGPARVLICGSLYLAGVVLRDHG